MPVLFLFSLLSCVCVLQANAQQPDFSSYTLRDGLSSYNAICMVQDRYGFLWIGTQDGLNRFDGKEFEQYNKIGPIRTRLLHNHVKCLALVQDTLWISTAIGGVNFINVMTGDVIGSLTPASHPDFNYWVESFCMDDSLVWMGSYNGLMCYNKRNSKIKSWKTNPFRKDGDYELRKILKAGDRWLVGGADNDGIAIYDRQTYTLVKQYSLKKLLPDCNEPIVFNTLQLWGDTLLCGTQQGCYLFKIDFNRLSIELLPIQPFSLKTSVTSFLKLKENLYAITTDIGLFYFNEHWKQLLHYSKENSPIGNEQINGCFIDRQGNSWLMTYGGLVKISNNNEWFTKIETDPIDGTRLSNISGLCNLNSGWILAPSWKELLTFNPTIIRVKKISNALQDGTFYNSYICKNGQTIVSSLRGNYYLKDLNRKQSLIPFSYADSETGLPSQFRFNSVLPYDDTTIFFGAEFNDGLFVGGKHPVTLTNLSASPLRLTEPSINGLYRDKQDFIWCLHDNSIDIIDWQHKKISTIKTGKLPYDPDGSAFFDVVENNGFIWLATYGSGIFYRGRNMANWSVLNTTNGLCNNAVYTLCEENDSIIWASTNIGLSRINTKTLTISNFFSARDKTPVHFDERGVLKHDSSIYFAGPDGVIRYAPWLYKASEERPITYIKNISYYKQGVQTILTDIEALEVQIPYNAYNIKITFTAIDFNAPELTEFFYRFRNRTKDWTGVKEQNNLILSEMPIGNNILELKAKSNNGKWSISNTSIHIQVLPPWYKTIWFTCLLFLAGLVFMYLLYRYRILQLRREEANRTRIAADLHDEIGSTLTSIKVFTDLGIAQSSTTYLPQIKQGIIEAAGSLRDIIWVLDRANNTAKDLMDRITRYAAPVAQASNILFILNTDEKMENFELKTELKRELYLIIKEFINNSFKYAQCSELTIEAKMKNKYLFITLKDNGIGFDPVLVKKGNGINNMQNRAKKVGYIASISSQYGNGTSLELLPK